MKPKELTVLCHYPEAGPEAGAILRELFVSFLHRELEQPAKTPQGSGDRL